MTLENLIDDLQAIPFLFVGPGLSKRYYHLPNCNVLLKQMVKLFKDNPLAYCLYENDVFFKGDEYGVNHALATLIERDFNTEWFDNEEIRNLDEYYINKVINGCSPFKAELCNYLKNNSILDKSKIDEVTLLQHIANNSIAGIITTNYDLFLETYLSDFKVHVGQNDLLFSRLQGIAEIYKIYGSINEPKSIVINERDYKEFKEKIECIIVKLLPIVIENPIIFIGYSTKDIRYILSCIVKYLPIDQVNKLKNKLIFIEYEDNFDGYKIDKYTLVFEKSKILPMTRIKLSDYSLIYHAIENKKMKAPIHLLRQHEDDMHSYILTNKLTEYKKVQFFECDQLLKEKVDIYIDMTKS